MKLKLLVVLLFPMSVLASNTPSSSCVSAQSYPTVTTQCIGGVVTSTRGSVMVVCNVSADPDIPPVCTKVDLDTE